MAGESRLSLRPSVRRERSLVPSSGHSALPACTPTPGASAPLCQSPRGMGAERLLPNPPPREESLFALVTRSDGALCSSLPSAPSLSCSLNLFCSLFLS